MSFSNNPARKSLSSLFQQRCFVCSSPQWILLFHHRSYPFSHRWRRTHSRALCGSKGYVCGEEEEEIIVASIRFPLVHTHTSHTYIHPTANNCQTNISPPGHNLHTYGGFKKKERREYILHGKGLTALMNPDPPPLPCARARHMRLHIYTYTHTQVYLCSAQQQFAVVTYELFSPSPPPPTPPPKLVWG